MPQYFDREQAKETISHVLNKIKTEEDIGLLAEYYRLFKKEVSVFNRSKVTAHLLMWYDKEKLPHYARKSSHALKEDAPHGQPLAEEESKRLFFNVGKNRRVFPRDILGLINTKTSVAREDIGGMRILDNYSFVQVRNTVAETIIEALNGVKFRGRPLTVNYAKSHSEQDQNHTEEKDI